LEYKQCALLTILEVCNYLVGVVVVAELAFFCAFAFADLVVTWVEPFDPSGMTLEFTVSVASSADFTIDYTVLATDVQDLSISIPYSSVLDSVLQAGQVYYIGVTATNPVFNLASPISYPKAVTWVGTLAPTSSSSIYNG